MESARLNRYIRQAKVYYSRSSLKKNYCDLRNWIDIQTVQIYWKHSSRHPESVLGKITKILWVWQGLSGFFFFFKWSPTRLFTWHFRETRTLWILILKIMFLTSEDASGVSFPRLKSTRPNTLYDIVFQSYSNWTMYCLRYMQSWLQWSTVDWLLFFIMSKDFGYI